MVLVPGLTGDHSELYSMHIIRDANMNGYDCVVANYRGLSGVPLKVSIFVVVILLCYSLQKSIMVQTIILSKKP